MSNYKEGCTLTLEEIAAVLSLAGVQTLVGFHRERTGELTREKLVSACCSLMNDNMMTRINGKFRLCGSLAAVMKNLCRVTTLVAVNPPDDLHAQVIYYVSSEGVTALEMGTHGRYVLTALEPEEVPEDLAGRMDLSFPEGQEKDGEASEAPELTTPAEDSRSALLEGAGFLAERLDAATGDTKAWLRSAEQDVAQWLQWSNADQTGCEPLTEENLTRLVLAIMRGEI